MFAYCSSAPWLGANIVKEYRSACQFSGKPYRIVAWQRDAGRFAHSVVLLTSGASLPSGTAGTIFLIIYIYPTMHFGPETAPALRANVTGLASSARHQCVAFN